MTLQWTDRVVVITGGGNGLGRSYALFFGSRGAKVLVNDYSKANADAVVAEIKAAGGEAVANYDSVAEGAKVVNQAVEKWGRIDVLINNAGILRDISFLKMTDAQWDQIQEIHVRAAFVCTKAAWPHMRKQKFGRIINTTSGAGIYGNFGQANYSAGKFAVTGFSRTLAIEGAKYNITANTIAPIAASQLTATVMPPELLAKVSPEMVVPLVAYLVHPDTTVTGTLYEVGAGWYGKVRWERSKGVIFRTDESFTPAAVKQRWNEVNDFTNADHPETGTEANHQAKLEASKTAPHNIAGPTISFAGKTVLVTGGAHGLGKSYALMYAKAGANVVVNDIDGPGAEATVNEIKAAGGKAAAVILSTEEGDKVVAEALKCFGSLHVLALNAGCLRDKSFLAMSEDDWDTVYNVHLRGSYKVAHAAWPIFQKQKYGRIITTTSPSGIYGNFGQANYATAKAALIGFTKVLAIEGKKYNIFANVIAPMAGTNMTRTIWPESMVRAYSPDYVAPVVLYLTSEASTQTYGLFEVSGGWVASYRWQRSYGHAFPINKKVLPEDIKAKWDAITRFDEKATNPASTADSMKSMSANFENKQAGEDDPYFDSQDPPTVAEAKQQIAKGTYSYTERDVILYNLGIGAGAKDLKWVYENADGFTAIPTFGVIPAFPSSMAYNLRFLPNFQPLMVLHGEQYLKILAPIPTSGTLSVESRIAEVLDKGKAAALTSVSITKSEDGTPIFESHSTTFIRGSGGFGGRKTGIDRGAASATNKPPSRKADAVVEEKTSVDQAAVYRLSGDYNPLHIDPAAAAVGNFPAPILHGLSFFGFAGKHVVSTFGPIQDIKVRFAGSLYPGETIVTSMWKDGKKVIFESKCKERNTVIISAAGATLV